MDLKIRLSLLLLLTYASSTQCKNPQNDQHRISHHSHPHHHHHPRLHRMQRHLQRPTRALSEYLVPPPAPLNFRGPRGSSAPSRLNPTSNQITPLSPHHIRAGRYINNNNNNNHLNNNNNNNNNNSNNGPSYLNKLMSWFNPFTGADATAKNKDSKPQGSSSIPVVQYAPLQPYTGTSEQYISPPNSQSGLAAWMSGKPCNPCNQVPWIPVVHNDNSHSGRYAAGAGGNAYLPPPSSQNQQSSNNYLPPTSEHSEQQSVSNLNVYTGVKPPVFNAKPFRDASPVYSPPNFNRSPSSNVDSPPPPPPSNLDQQPPPNFNHQPPLSFDPPPPLPPSNLDHQPRPDFSHQPPSNFNHQPQPNFNHQTQTIFERPPADFDHQPPQDFQNQPSNFDHQPAFDQSPSNFDHRPSQNYRDQAPPNYDQPPPNFDHQQTYNQSPVNVDHHAIPADFNRQTQSSPNGHASPIFDGSPNFESATYEDHPISNFEQHHQPSQQINIIKEAPTILPDHDVNQSQDADHAESRPVFVSSERPAAKPNTNIHFQRSPLIDLTVAGESSIATPVYKQQKVTKGKTTAEVIDYIVSSPDEAFGSSEGKETRTTTTTMKTIVTTTTPRPVDQKLQESKIETLVQSFEIFKKRNNETTSDNETWSGGRGVLSEGEDSSASREVLVPSKTDNGKKIIQIIIPYTSQYTPSPFHPTKSVDAHWKKPTNVEKKSQQKYEETTPMTINVDIESVEDNVVIEESRRVSVTRPPDLKQLQNNKITHSTSESSVTPGNTIDVHRLQKNIDNWTIQEYSKSSTGLRNSANSTYPRWLSSKQIPDEYLVSNVDFDDSNEYYDFNDTKSHRGTNRTEETITTRTTSTTPTTTTEATTKVNIINATYPYSSKKLPHSQNSSSDSERVYVVTPIPNPNSLEDLTSKPSRRLPKGKQQDSASVERAYQVLPQAVNNLAVVANAPESAAPALWGIMEHEEIATSADQPRWRSESDVLPEVLSTPILYTGHSKVSRAR